MYQETELSHTAGKDYLGTCHNGTFLYFRLMNTQYHAITELSCISGNVAFLPYKLFIDNKTDSNENWC